MGFPQSAQKIMTFGCELFAFPAGFLFGHAGVHFFCVVYFKLRRLKLEMCLAFQQHAAHGGYVVCVGRFVQQFGKPLRRGSLYFALRQFPQFQRVKRGRSGVAAFFVLVQQFQCFLT
jgi:hypothetical protein